MDYFRNDVQAIVVGGLSIENGNGSVTIHGSLEIMADTASLGTIRLLRRHLDEMESALTSVNEEGALTITDDVPVLETVANPFG
jgi:hypothetical protein